MIRSGPRRAGKARRRRRPVPAGRLSGRARVRTVAATAIAALAAGPALAQAPTEAGAAPPVAEGRPASVDRATMDRHLMAIYGPRMPFDAADRLEVDLTCDGAVDQVAGWYDPGGPGGPSYAVAVASADTPDGAVALIPFDLPLDPGRQVALCPVDDPADIRLGIEKWSAADQRDALGTKLSCPRAIVIIDGQCDSPRLFWAGFEGEGPPLLFFRR